MAKGESGRVVIEVDPDLKRHIYSVLAIKNLTLKEWFIGAAQQYVAKCEEQRANETRPNRKNPRKA